MLKNFVFGDYSMIDSIDNNEILNRFNSISLTELEQLNLLNRYDTKFLIPKNYLNNFLCQLTDNFSVLEINGLRNFAYRTLYFDTENNEFYHQHHNGKCQRSKIRYRHYVDSDVYYFELKQRNNYSFTSKKRVRVDSAIEKVKEKESELLKSELNLDLHDLYSKVLVQYDRITLVNSFVPEKITIDTNIKFSNTDNSVNLDNVVLVELKQKRFNHNSDTYNILKGLNIHSIDGFSKYCMAMIYTNTVSKFNRFKPKVMLLNKIMDR